MAPNIIEQLELLERRIREIRVKDLEMERMKQAARLLGDYGENCSRCHQLRQQMEQHVHWLSEEANVEDMAVVQVNRNLLKDIVRHLHKSHEVLPENHYTMIYMGVGTALGITFGLTLFDNLGLGIVIGLGLGVGIGSWLDTRAKNRGRTL